MKKMLSSIMIGLAVFGYTISYAAASKSDTIDMKKVPANDFTALAIYLHDHPYNFMVLTHDQVQAIVKHRAKFDKVYHGLYKEPVHTIIAGDLERSAAYKE